MKKTLIRSLIVGLIFAFVYYAIQIIRGMYLSMKYVPEIVNKNTTMDYLQHKITFGHEYSSMWRIIEFSSLMLLGIIVYFSWRIMRNITTATSK
ncbi:MULTISPECIES: hypothetical protein [Paenibacillus]|uniref:hypothetical protein n=1 Tax=Paenibacillus TaxID=44249 RepID=UPI0004F61FD2|nr:MULTISPECIES: hypothetical protein [unclassified Paenibacillus]AIQ31163.1 hypothetical protein P40081_25565 [Paenibacillus sp. FSL P4-0081]OMF20308.1 hypothetical protein BK132_34935 [Paenibacillus sp. FSL H8-0259]